MGNVMTMSLDSWLDRNLVWRLVGEMVLTLDLGKVAQLGMLVGYWVAKSAVKA